ncbi:hypothetical protein TWF694_008359 [Orbilia ellipsospora]|uniref:Apple domain-containing protein n=1 Tax=Orbilia ellipsospora TaxID=2528407 RepID=A0AAV9XMI3_9PEZI
MRFLFKIFAVLSLLQLCTAIVIPNQSAEKAKRNGSKQQQWPYGYCKSDHTVNSCISDIELIWKDLAKAFCKIYVRPTTKTTTTTKCTTKTVAGYTDFKTVTAVDATDVVVETVTVVSTVSTATNTDTSFVSITDTETNVIPETTIPEIEVITFTVTPNPIISLPITLTLQPLLTSIPTVTIPSLPTITFKKRDIEKIGYFKADEPAFGARIRRRNEDHSGDWHGFDGSHVSKACSCLIGKPTVIKTVTATSTKTVGGGIITKTVTKELTTEVTSITTEIDPTFDSTDITVIDTTIVDTTTVDTTSTVTATVTDYETLDIFYPTSCIQYTAAQANPSQIYTDLQTTFALDTTDEYEAIMMCSQACFNQAANSSSGTCKAFNIFKAAGFDTYFCTVKISASGLTTDFSEADFLGISDSQIFSADTVSCPVVTTTEE